jgi:hypothetical protein
MAFVHPRSGASDRASHPSRFAIILSGKDRLPAIAVGQRMGKAALRRGSVVGGWRCLPGRSCPIELNARYGLPRSARYFLTPDGDKADAS